ncbi:hypothetical protein [Brevibacterium picturae]|uniref:SRPBCC family protein n=1 Tax=Brevibacterium picturae TaxID=260553 RepID=A0ABN2C325_9MICO
MSFTKRVPGGIRNVHRRTYNDIDRAWALGRRVHEPESGVWPVDGWPPMLLDHGLTPGSSGGHGPVRYRVAHVDDDRFRFELTMPKIVGFHEFRLAGDTLEHVLQIERPSLVTRLAVIPLHDAILEELLDDIEDLLAGRTPPRPRERTLLVRVLKRFS